MIARFAGGPLDGTAGQVDDPPPLQVQAANWSGGCPVCEPMPVITYFLQRGWQQTGAAVYRAAGHGRGHARP